MARFRGHYIGERLTEFVGVKMTPSGRRGLERDAKTVGVGISELARLVLERRQIPRGGRDPQAIRSLVAQIAHVGNNVNQLAHIANQNGQVRSEQALEAVTQEIIAALRKVMEL